MRKSPAAMLAATVLYPTFKSFVTSKLSIKVNMPVFAAVSPNLDNGP